MRIQSHHFPITNTARFKVVGWFGLNKVIAYAHDETQREWIKGEMVKDGAS